MPRVLSVTSIWRVTAVLLVSCVCIRFLLLSSNHCVSEYDDSDGDDPSWQRKIRLQSENEAAQTKPTEEKELFKNALMFPTPPRRDKGFLTIGIPTVRRKNASYLPDTVTSLLKGMTPLEQTEVVIVIFLADRDSDVREVRGQVLKAYFNESIANGTIRIIQAPSNYYPDLKIYKTTFKESKKYVKWRAKQVLDYVYLLKYSTNISTYYMQLEDDVVTSPGYINSIKTFIHLQKRAWTCLEFSELGFIGKLYRSYDLKKLADLMKLFYIEQPVDNIYTYFNLLNTQMTQRLLLPTLFQHKGLHSSFTGKIQRLQDRFFTEKQIRGNPLADVTSSCTPLMTYYPELAYIDGSDGYFWTNGPPHVGCDVTVVFHKPEKLRHIVVETGADLHRKDTLRYGSLFVGFTVTKDKGIVRCDDVLDLGSFHDGRIEVGNLEENVEKKVACFIIKVTRKQSTWLIVSDIRVQVSNTTTTS